MPVQRKQGDLIQADFFDNSGGLNITDAPFRVQDNQAIGGYNYDYVITGGLQKRYGHGLLSAAPDTQIRSLGFGLHATSANVKTLIRAAGTQLQTMGASTGVCTTVLDDQASPSSSFFNSTTPVVFSQFNTIAKNTLWCTGGGLASGVVLGYNGTLATQNGSYVPAGNIDLAASGSDGTLPAGTYYYAVALHKLATGAISNAVLDAPVTVGATEHVMIDLTDITGTDTTKYDKYYIYRSAISGSSGFTTGDLAGTVSTAATSFTDLGAVQGTASAIPRSGSASLDNSTLPSGTYKTITTWKRRLVTAQGSTVYISDLNKPESWPAQNPITIPSGGDITALGIISFSTSNPTTSANDEILVIFKEKELWVINGSSSSDFSLKFIDYVGCIAQPLLVLANGYLSWIDYRGVYLWDGSYKPIYVSRPIEYDFSVQGDIDLARLGGGWGTFYRKQNQIIWVLPSVTQGIQKIALKLDVRLTYPQISNALEGRIMEGVFAKDMLTYPLYAGFSTLPNSNETLYAGDSEGNIYTLFSNVNADVSNIGNYWDTSNWDQDFWDYTGDVSVAIPCVYQTKILDLGLVGSTKRFHKVVVWCRENSTANLTLNYWVDYKLDIDHQATQSQPIANRSISAYWDQSNWDAVYWDRAVNTYNPVVFNLNNGSVGIDGDAITLQFVQGTVNSPLMIAGFSVIYSEIGLRK